MHEQERVKRQVKEAIEAHGESQMEREATRRREEQFRMEELRTTQMVGSAQFFKLLPATLGALLLFAVSEAGLIISMVERDTKTLNDGTRTYEGRQAYSTFGIALTAAGCVGATVPSEAHAWVEWWDDGWTAYDPTCDAAPDDRYVSIGAGRDHDDVPPLRGIYSGASTADMSVEVEVTRLA